MNRPTVCKKLEVPDLRNSGPVSWKHLEPQDLQISRFVLRGKNTMLGPNKSIGVRMGV